MTLQEFIAREGWTMDAVWHSRRPDADDADWSAGSSHWLVTITGNRASGRRGIVWRGWFSMGSACKGEPKIEGVAECLQSDWSGVLDQAFEGWAEDLGLDPDSRKAERIFRACLASASRARRALGADRYDEFLACEEEG